MSEGSYGPPRHRLAEPLILSDATGLPLTGARPHVRLPAQPASSGCDSRSTAMPLFYPRGRGSYRTRPARSTAIRPVCRDSLTWCRPVRGVPVRMVHLSYWLSAPERRWYFVGGVLDVRTYMHQWQQDLSEVHSYRRDDVPTELWPWLLRRGYVGRAERSGCIARPITCGSVGSTGTGWRCCARGSAGARRCPTRCRG